MIDNWTLLRNRIESEVAQQLRDNRRSFWAIVWDFCEYWHISLGSFAPWVFGQAIGRKGKKVNK